MKPKGEIENADLSIDLVILFEIMGKLQFERIYVFYRVNAKLNSNESVKGKSKLPDR